ncbi:MAG TPA: GspE/PulE family protein [Armatimonadaceae bacterium]|nr:GspE/PulE family protein [Armatimonadaceae bacterium]
MATETPIPGAAGGGEGEQPQQTQASKQRVRSLEDTHIDELLHLVVKQEASDLHIAVGLPPVLRVHGKLLQAPYEPYTPQTSQRMIYDILTDEQIQKFESTYELDFSYSLGRTSRFRVNVFRDKGTVASAFRRIPTAIPTLADLGLPPVLEKLTHLTRGLILVTGPTGSGKSTTLYATLNLLNDATRNLVTVEDPVEYRLANVNQVQTNPKAGLTFATALRSILRQDPDVVLVGEIRDRETGVIAIEAALTGHLVLSTLHTNDAPSTPLRLIEMGIEPFLVTSALDCVLAQRLARRLCERCKEPYGPSEEDLVLSSWDLTREPPTGMHRAVGCAHCGGTGYRGRTAIHEVMLLSEEIDRLIVSRASSDDIRRVALEQGMVPLRQDGLDKVARGNTTLEEVSRVVA